MATTTECTNGVACFHGSCVVSATSGVETCKCSDLYSGSQCSYRDGLLYTELPLAAFVVFVFVLMGLREAATAQAMLRFPQSKQDFFAFPRELKSTSWSIGSLKRCVGTWEGPARKHIVLKPHRRITRVLIIVVAVLELLPFLQLTAIVFMPIVPWPATSKATAEFLRVLLLQPFWSHLKPHEYPEFMLYLAVVAVPVILLIACVLGIKRFPLLKPQPRASPVEDLSSLALRVYSSWVVLPLMMLLLMPLECFFVGYRREGSWVLAPVHDPVCFTWLRVGHAALGFAATSLYSFLASGVSIQLNCESSFPEPVLWSDARYIQIVFAIHAPMALSVTAFGNSNPWALCLCSMLAGVVLLVANLWMRPCIYVLINWLRIYGATLVIWTGAIGTAVCIQDDPTEKSLYEVWSLGVIGISAVCFSSMLVQYLEEFWLMVTVRGARHLRTPELVKPDTKASPPPLMSTQVSASTANHSETALATGGFKPKLPPLHVLKKRSRRSLAET